MAIIRRDTAGPEHSRLYRLATIRTHCAPTGATSLLTDGIPRSSCRAGLGHADRRTTGRYVVVRSKRCA